MGVTFDSNVLQRVVFPDCHRKDPNYICLLRVKEALQDGRVHGFICESVATLEIKQDSRAGYFPSLKSNITVRTERIGSNTSLKLTIETDHTLHPGLHWRLAETLQEARAKLGMRLLSAPRLNLPLPSCFLDDPTFYDPQVFSSAEYAERFGEIAAAIEARGVGGGRIAIVSKRQGPQPRGYVKAISEWADGDLVASHIASANDLLCTEDQGRDGPSIFDEANRTWLSATYRVELVTIPELAALLAK